MSYSLISGMKLSKKFFMCLSEGLYLTSNTRKPGGEPMYADIVEPIERRDDQWRRIRAAKVDQGNCHVYISKEKYLEECKNWKVDAKGRLVLNPRGVSPA